MHRVLRYRYPSPQCTDRLCPDLWHSILSKNNIACFVPKPKHQSQMVLFGVSDGWCPVIDGLEFRTLPPRGRAERL